MNKQTGTWPEPEVEFNHSLSSIQKELKAPKNQYNKFGGYNYRNCEDIVEAVKKIMPIGAIVSLSDEIIQIGERYYIKSTAIYRYFGLTAYSSGYAREPLSKKGMDESQITGAASSYARKYALNGLFMIDDTKDADSKDNSSDECISKPCVIKPQSIFRFDQKKHDPEEELEPNRDEKVRELKLLIEEKKISNEWVKKSLDKLGAKSIDDLMNEHVMKMISHINK